MNKTKILIVDDEPDILDFLQYNFQKEGYEIITANNGVKAISAAIKHNPDLIILDVMMPEMDGIEVCRKLRENSELNSIILLLTARSEDYTEIAGFDAGTDDFVTKPIRPRALLVRVKALLKRGRSGIANSILDFGCLMIDKEKRKVYVDGNVILLPKKEFDLLILLSSNPEKVFSRFEIYKKIWGPTVIVGERTLDVHIRKLRKLIGKNYIKTTKGVGYAFRNKPKKTLKT